MHCNITFLLNIIYNTVLNTTVMMAVAITATNAI